GGHARPRLRPAEDLPPRLPAHHDRGARRPDRRAARRNPQPAARIAVADGGLFAALTRACRDDWQAYVDHPFVRGLADGSLPEACFRHYLAQDYVFLLHYSRAWSLAVVKSEQLDD